jgi:recombinational DNA repair ATPase RecF
LILANARALAEDFGAPPLLLLDEVAAHLDAGAARRFMTRSAPWARRPG